MVRVSRWLEYGLILMPVGLASCLHGASTLPISAISAINRLGIDANLELCLDVADVDSYSGSGQTWSDLSGNSYDFLRGATSGSEASDPAFNGTAGNLLSSTYWSFDNGDFFTLGQSNPAWVTNLHKNNAAFTLMFWVYAQSVGAINSQYLFSTIATPATDTGFGIYFGYDSGEGSVNATALNAGSTAYLGGTVGEAVDVNDGAWNFVAFSLDEAVGAGGVLFQINDNGFVDNTASTYTSPSTGNATNTVKVGAGGSGLNTLDNGSRIAVTCGWSRALSAAEIDAFFQATRQRFGI